MANPISLQSRVEEIVRIDDAADILFGKPEVDGHARKAVAIQFVRQSNPVVGIRHLLCVVSQLEPASPVAEDIGGQLRFLENTVIKD